MKVFVDGLRHLLGTPKNGRAAVRRAPGTPAVAWVPLTTYSTASQALTPQEAHGRRSSNGRMHMTCACTSHAHVHVHVCCACVCMCMCVHVHVCAHTGHIQATLGCTARLHTTPPRRHPVGLAANTHAACVTAALISYLQLRSEYSHCQGPTGYGKHRKERSGTFHPISMVDWLRFFVNTTYARNRGSGLGGAAEILHQPRKLPDAHSCRAQQQPPRRLRLPKGAFSSPRT